MADIRNSFMASSIPFQFIVHNLFNRMGLFLLWVCGAMTAYVLLHDGSYPPWMYIIGSIVWTIGCGFGLAALAFSAAMADLFASGILGKLIKTPSPTNAVHRVLHACMSALIFVGLFSLIMANWFGHIDDGCDGRYPRC